MAGAKEELEALQQERVRAEALEVSQREAARLAQELGIGSKAYQAGLDSIHNTKQFLIERRNHHIEEVCDGLTAPDPSVTFTKEMKEVIMDAFDEFDLDDNGTLDMVEFTMLLLKLNPLFSASDVDEMIATADVNGDKVIDINEFLKWIFHNDFVSEFLASRLPPGRTIPESVVQREKYRKVLEAAFEDFDTDGNGIIDMEEFTNCLKQLSPFYQEKDILDMFEAVDLDKSGTIEFEEFMTWVDEHGSISRQMEKLTAEKRMLSRVSYDILFSNGTQLPRLVVDGSASGGTVLLQDMLVTWSRRVAAEGEEEITLPVGSSVCLHLDPDGTGVYECGDDRRGTGGTLQYTCEVIDAQEEAAAAAAKKAQEEAAAAAARRPRKIDVNIDIGSFSPIQQGLFRQLGGMLNSLVMEKRVKKLEDLMRNLDSQAQGPDTDEHFRVLEELQRQLYG